MHGRWLPFVQLGALAIWPVWMLAPPSVIPSAGFWVEVLVPGIAFGLLFVWSGLTMYRGTSSRRFLGWAGLIAVGVVLYLEAVFLLMMATFPADF